ncbi:hypothetical protein [Bergeyella zoohelcum]|uniref:hypothetical protein n=1 Tax=Bergeyella zoohelcum TaxID=1015 RepID=UPI002A918B84|nr:hypothetical protein [Bergeyella zoohelcum]MDY6024851.1 hypothetical protein [Bergeyella zoohelcum]
MASADGTLKIGSGTAGLSLPNDNSTAEISVGQMVIENLDCTAPRINWEVAISTGRIFKCTRDSAGKSVWMVRNRASNHVQGNFGGVKYPEAPGRGEWLIMTGLDCIAPPTSGKACNEYANTNVRWGIRIK